MSHEITNPGVRKLAVVSGRAHPKLAEEIAAELGVRTPRNHRKFTHTRIGKVVTQGLSLSCQ